MKLWWAGWIVLFLGLPRMGAGFVFQFKNTDPTLNYRIFSASLQNLEQNSGISQASFEQAYEAFLRTDHVDMKANRIFLKGEYRYSQRVFQSKEAFQSIGQDKVYHSEFSRDGQGILTALSPQDYYPSIRSVPSFPKENIPLGGVWENSGHEYQDFSLLGYPSPFHVPFYAKYQYVGDILLSSKQVADIVHRYAQYNFTISDEVSKILALPSPSHEKATEIAILYVSYQVRYDEAQDPMQTKQMRESNHNPVTQARGFYRGIVFWDKQKQEEKINVGEYDFFYDWMDHEHRHWSGKEYGIINILKQDREKIDQLAKEVRTLGKGLEVEKRKRGVKIILGDLLFHFNKTDLRPNVKETLSHVVQILSANPNYAIHITGYSDDIGSLESKEKIANGRACTVANFLLEHGITSNRVDYEGDGDRHPRVPNTSALNRKKNRRVEIDIITE